MTPSFQDIVSATAKHFELEPCQLYEKNRRGRKVQARYVVYTLTREMKGWGTVETAVEFDMHHSTFIKRAHNVKPEDLEAVRELLHQLKQDEKRPG